MVLKASLTVCVAIVIHKDIHLFHDGVRLSNRFEHLAGLFDNSSMSSFCVFVTKLVFLSGEHDSNITDVLVLGEAVDLP